MKQISNKQLSGIISEDIVLSECNYSSISIDNKDVNLSASLDLLNLEFKCALWIGSDLEETDLSEDQKDSIYFLLLNTQSSDNEFSYYEQDHALTLIYS